MAKGAPGRTHGTESTYQAGCRLECCREAHRQYAAERRGARVAQQTTRPRGPGPARHKGGYAIGDTLEELLDAW